MGERCITHQFLAKDKKCFVGKHVRLGKEAGTTPLWCEPRAPEKWIGRKLARATAMDAEEGEAARNKCDWGERWAHPVFVCTFFEVCCVRLCVVNMTVFSSFPRSSRS